MYHASPVCTANPFTTLTSSESSSGACRAIGARVAPLLSCLRPSSHRWRGRQAPASVWAPSGLVVAAVHGAVFLETDPTYMEAAALAVALLPTVVEGEADLNAVRRGGLALALAFAASLTLASCLASFACTTSSTLLGESRPLGC